jgi:hypothetical protein
MQKGGFSTRMCQKATEKNSSCNKQNKDIASTYSLSHSNKETDYTVLSRTIMMNAYAEYRGSHNKSEKTYCQQNDKDSF